MAKYTNYTEHNKGLPKPVYPNGHVETIEEFLARGGKITILPPYKDPNRISDEDVARPVFDPRGMYDL